jgi:hypothetical protein
VSMYMKAILAAAIPIISAIGSWIITGTIDAPELALALTGLVTAILVAIFRNREAGLLSALKFIVAATTPLVSALIQYVVTGAFNRAELATIVVGLLTSILVYLSANAPESVES